MSDGRHVMGTVLEVTLAGDRETLEEVFALALHLDRTFTTWDAASPVSRLNQSSGGGPRGVEPEVARILRDARDYGRLTGGVFDVTVGPLVQLWREGARRDRLPSAAKIAKARSRVGVEAIRFHPDARVELPLEGMAVDFGGLAKGWALDRVGELLRERGVSSALLSFGGSSILALGTPARQPGWHILLAGTDQQGAGRVLLRNHSLSVSRSLGLGWEIEGRRYGHVIDPRTGRPVSHELAAAVVAPTGALAEALSTALLVLDVGEGLALLETLPGCEGFVMDATGRRSATSGWHQSVAFEPPAN